MEHSSAVVFTPSVGNDKAATIAWIAANAKSPLFEIVTDCCDCKEAITIYRGMPGVLVKTNVPCGQYVIDVAVCDRPGRLVAAITVCRSIRASGTKMATLAAASYCNAFEVAAVDVDAVANPLKLRSARSVTCKLCIILNVCRRRDALEEDRAFIARRLIRRWRCLAVRAITARVRRIGQRWLFLARFKTVAKRVAALYAAEEADRIRGKCNVCHGLVVGFVWKYTGEAATWGYEKRMREYKVHNGLYYHTGCLTRCKYCGGVLRHGQKCACDARRTCSDCQQSFSKHDVSAYAPHPSQRHCPAWVCGRCGVACRTCNEITVRAQTKFGGSCYECNNRAKRHRMDTAGTDRRYCRCGRAKQSGYASCKQCASLGTR